MATANSKQPLQYIHKIKHYIQIKAIYRNSTKQESTVINRLEQTQM